ncbi:MAG: hypothetical protein JW904_14320 [Spirochaetales bacterium]|nr:hypothetical protein [Spirochaetales bacterium]
MKQAFFIVASVFFILLFVNPLFSDEHTELFTQAVASRMGNGWQEEFKNEISVLINNKAVSAYTLKVTGSVLKTLDIPDDPVWAAHLAFDLLLENEDSFKKGISISQIRVQSAVMWKKSVMEKKTSAAPPVKKDVIETIVDDNKVKLDKDVKIKIDKDKVKIKIDDKVKDKEDKIK